MAANPTSEPGRNEPCSCGSGKKYKHCCLAKDQAAERAAREKEAKKAAAKAKRDAKKAAEKGESDESTSTQSKGTPKKGSAAPAQDRRGPTSQPWKRKSQHNQSFQQRSVPQKKGGG